MPRDIIFKLRKIRNKQKIIEDGGGTPQKPCRQEDSEVKYLKC